MSVLVVIPTYDEAENVADVVGRVRASVPEAHVLVVDDNSPDGTADLAEAVGAELGQVDVLRRPEKGGLGPAYRAGFAWGLARGFDVLVEMDADLSHDPAALPDLLAAVEGGADLAIGSRYVPGGQVPGWPRHRLAISRVGNSYASLALGIDLRDATGGYRAYTADALRSLDLDQITTYGYGFQVEMAYSLVRSGHRVVEVPITFRDRIRGTSKMSLAIVGEALRLVTWWGFRDRVLRRGREASASRAAGE
ncbi:polyprenol monophosphomannose synthase [Iamia majanohamensis]|uniref:Polyprenol monophosphomannose synthase n=1 Tax=Iamia majanohamensis TaxID=467976 RepID=A0AAE9Y6P2_9ACTN|nr:polyprenol monophosphomannose synthase [Iamia majanohamensis]WCO65249.1 polyprenol monophosphomannose synthase [Iamia majanohamensis]